VSSVTFFSSLSRQNHRTPTRNMESNPKSLWSNIVKKDPPPKPSPSDGALAPILGMVGNCRSRKGISTAVVDASAFIEGRLSLTNLADKFVTVRKVYSEIRDSHSRSRLDFLPFTIEEMKPSPESISKEATGDLQTLSKADLKLIALTYTLEAQVHGTKHLRDVPPPIQTVSVRRSHEKELLGWGSNVANLEEWEELEKESDQNANSNSNSKLLPLKDISMNIIIPSDNSSEVGSVLSHTEHQEEGERKHPLKKTEGKMVVEGIDASQGQFDDEDSAVSSSTRRKFLRRKARWKHYKSLAEQEIQQEAEKAGNMTVHETDLHKQSNQISKDANEICTKDSGKSDEDPSSSMRFEEGSLKALQEGPEETNVEPTLINGEDGIEKMEIFEASSVADDGSREQSRSFGALSESSVACLTGDYAMQNVILQMGLRLLSPQGMQIRQLNRWHTKCHACKTVVTLKSHAFSNIREMYCPKCGNGGTLRKVVVTTSENGTTIAVREPRITIRGTKFSIPMPKGGRDAITKNMALREDQLPQRFLHPKTKKKASKPGDEYFASDDVFMNHHSYKKAPLQPPVREAMAVFSQKRNPNDNHYSRSRH
ncbi:unnamed protein product, partial [Thlaspi arvense]